MLFRGKKLNHTATDYRSLFPGPVRTDQPAELPPPPQRYARQLLDSLISAALPGASLRLPAACRRPETGCPDPRDAAPYEAAHQTPPYE